MRDVMLLIMAGAFHGDISFQYLIQILIAQETDKLSGLNLE